MAMKASMYVKMATILSLCLMLVAFAESRATVTFTATRTTLTDDFQSKVVCKQVVGAKSGDDCTTVSKKFKMSVDLFLVINPNINCDHIFAGQWLCVGAKSGDDCTTVSKKFKMSVDLFLVINPNINCDHIFAGQWLCVAGTATN